jgi:uncharacterized membrane protein
MELGVLLLYLGLGVGKASLVSPVSASYVALTVVLAVIFLREKISKVQLSGVIMAVLGIILIGV